MIHSLLAGYQLCLEIPATPRFPDVHYNICTLETTVLVFQCPDAAGRTQKDKPLSNGSSKSRYLHFEEQPCTLWATKQEAHTFGTSW